MNKDWSALIQNQYNFKIGFIEYEKNNAFMKSVRYAEIVQGHNSITLLIVQC